MKRVWLHAPSLAVCFVTLANPADWPQFRGPDGQGHAAARDLPATWSETQNVAWRTPLPGRAWSSPVIEGNQIWLTTAIDSPISESSKARLLAANTGDQPLNLSGALSLRALCVDRESGVLVRNIELMTEDHPDPVHSLNSFASPSPVLEDGRLYCHFGSNGTACLDTRSGKGLWINRELRIRHENGAGSSPVLWEHLLIVHCDGSDLQYVAALDKRTGKLAWKTDRSGELDPNPQLKKAYGTPLVLNVGGRLQLISPGANWLYGYDPGDGKELWKLSYGVLGFSIVPRPVASADMVYMSTSFMQPELLAVKLPPDGGVPQIAWRFKKQAPQMPSPLLIGSELYLVSDKGIATCLDARSGEQRWTGRLGGNFCSSPLYADGRIYVSSQEGVTHVLAPGTTFKQVAANELNGQIMASPAAVDGALFIRTDKALYRIDSRK